MDVDYSISLCNLNDNVSLMIRSNTGMQTNWIELIEVHFFLNSDFTEYIRISKIIQSKRGIRLPDKMQPRQQRVLNTDMVAYAMCDSRFTICDLRTENEKRRNKTKATKCLSSKSSPFFESDEILCADRKK